MSDVAAPPGAGCAVKTARQWKEYYAAERARLGDAGLAALVERAPEVAWRRGGAVVVPHTKASESGALIAAAARALVAAGVDEVLAVGVLHSAREADAAEVARARAGDRDAVRALRRVHGPGVHGDDGRWAEEFSLDTLLALLPLAAARAGRRAPRVVVRYPFLVGDAPETLPGFDELVRLVARGAALVSTADPIHHGVGYETRGALRRHDDAATHDWARAAVMTQLEALAARRFAPFLEAAAAVRSDFRDAGPVVAALTDAAARPTLHALALVDYSDALGAPSPTWVAAALSSFA